MRLRAAWLLVGMLCCGSAVEAGWFHRDALPSPNGFPLPPPRSMDRRPKPGGAGQHPSKYLAFGWGRESKKVFKQRESHFGHSLFQH